MYNRIFFAPLLATVVSIGLAGCSGDRNIVPYGAATTYSLSSLELAAIEGKVKESRVQEATALVAKVN